jgi:hypothetical protein
MRAVNQLAAAMTSGVYSASHTSKGLLPWKFSHCPMPGQKKKKKVSKDVHPRRNHESQLRQCARRKKGVSKVLPGERTEDRHRCRQKNCKSCGSKRMVA